VYLAVSYAFSRGLRKLEKFAAIPGYERWA